jgi:hypothetical protein
MDTTWDDDAQTQPDEADFAGGCWTPPYEAGQPGEMFTVPDGGPLTSMASIGTAEFLTVVLGPGRSIDLAYDQDTGALKITSADGRVAVMHDDDGLALTVLP